MEHDFLVVGAGFSGAVCARQFADAGKKVLLVDKRSHIGGNAYDKRDDHGVLIHPYGPHVFHTNSKRVFEFLSRFTDWRFYEHRVLALVDGKLLPIPINRTTVNELYGLSLDESGVLDFFEKSRIPHDIFESSEDVVLNSVGRDLCDKFFRGYTLKQWGYDISELSASVAARIPTRSNDDDRYFGDDFQFMPAQGYAALFNRMLDHPLISIRLNTDFCEIDDCYSHMVYTGPIDEFYKYKFGHLSYRSLRFEHKHFRDIDQYQPTGTINYPNDYDYTRVTEFKHLTGEKSQGTSIVFEYPVSNGEPFYPIPRKENVELYKKYEAEADLERNVTFLGRLAQYQYYNMDQVIAQSLKKSRELIGFMS